MGAIPKWINSIRELIYWHYAKIIVEAKTGNRNDFKAIMIEYKKLKSDKIHISNILRDNKKLVLEEKKCSYCGTTDSLQFDHIIPLSKNGPDSIDNLTLACKKCNISKGDKQLMEWYGENYSSEIPRNVFSKFLKLVFTAHDNNNSLDTYDFNKDGILDWRDLIDIYSKK